MAHIFNELGDVYVDCDEEIERVLSVIGPAAIVELLAVLMPRRIIERGPWTYWMRICGAPSDGRELRDEAFGDPNRYFGGGMFACNGDGDDPYDPDDPTVLPLTDPDENTVWLVDRDTSEVYPAVVG